jgi:phosphatidylserine/phosphatidylglycerophosphate/cardiolipin synthase-like enzyme
MQKIFLLLLLTSSLMSQVIPIDSVRVQDGNGVPLLLGQTVTVRGVVTTSSELGVPLVYFQVPTAGLAAYDATFGPTVVRGDSVQVTGVVTQYNGLTELQPINSSTILGTNKVVTPVVINTNQIRVGGEPYEGRLIRINNIIAVKNTSGAPVTQWTVSSSGTNYRIFDGIDSCDIRIFATTNIANTPIPQFPFSVIALNSQFDSSPPYNSGYQIIPRALSDFITTSTGPLLSQITYTNIQTNSVTINWSTSVASDAKVRWMISDSNYQTVLWKDSVYDGTQTINHSINLTNLKSGTIYNFNITCSTGGSSTTSSVSMFATKSTSTGTINVYFNKSVDTTLNSGEKAQGNVNFQTKLLARINAAQYSIDMCLYSYDDYPQVTNALISALARGVKIRFVYDSRTNQAEVNNLLSAGIKIQKRNTYTGDIMHNKFFVIDYRDTTSANDDWLWAGSTNVTLEQFSTDANNVIELQDKTLAAIYTREFEEMWGSHTDNPNSSIAKFGPGKTDNVPHKVIVGTTPIDVYFSPSDNTSTQIENMINNYTDYDIYFCIYAFTRFNIENRMKAKFDAGKKVKGVFDQGMLNDPQFIYQEMKGIGGTSPWNPPADVWLDNQSGLLHHKYILIDALYPSSNPIVETGSYNFSNVATFGNDENYMIIYSPRIANLYVQEWYKRYKDGGGIEVIGIKQISNEIPDEYKLFQNYPNPFNPISKIKYQIASNVKSEMSTVKLVIFDILGKEISNLVNQNQHPGTYEVDFDASNFSSGVYFYTLKVNEQKIDTKRMMLIK